MNNFWNILTLHGSKTKYDINTLRDLRIINLVNILFIILFTFIGFIDLTLFFTGKTHFSLSTINTTLIAFLGFINLLLISRGLFLIVKIIISFVFPFLLLVLPLLQGHVIDEYFFWYPYVPTAFCIIPHLLFRQKKNWRYLFISLIAYLAFAVFADKILLIANTHELAILSIVQENILFYRVSSIGIFLFINASILYFLQLSNRYEEMLSIANAVLEEQREELRVQNETLLLQRKDLSNKNNEQEQLLLDLKAAQAQLVQTEKMTSLGTLTSGVAHEINKPLSLITSGLNRLNNLFEELKNPILHESDKGIIVNKCINTLPSSLLGTERIARIIRSLLSFSEKSNNINTDIHQVINSTLMIIGFKLSENLILEKNFANNLPEIPIQQDKIHQAIIAIIDNAVYFMKEKSELKNEKIIIKTYSEEDKKLCISIANNGMAIPDEIINKIFDPFFTTKPRGKGVGLGLANAYNNITAHNGEILAYNEEDFVYFVIKLPIYHSI